VNEKVKSYLSDAGLVYAALIWGSTFFIVKDSLTSVNPVTLVAYRFLIAALLLVPVLLYLKKPLFHNVKDGIILGVVIAALYLSQTIGLKFTSASNSGFITGLFIVFTPLLALAAGILPSKRRVMAILISIVGLFLLTGIGAFNRGDALTLIAAFTYAVHIVLTAKFVQRSDPYSLAFQQFLTTGILSLLIALIASQPLGTTTTTWYIILFLAVFPTALAFLIQAIAQQHTGPVKVALIFALEPVFAAVFAWTVGGELFTIKTIIGGLLIVAAMIIAELPETSPVKDRKLI
jgi:drug/metabolite transporter (DMT)-like permease